jgi:hypothetical protein
VSGFCCGWRAIQFKYSLQDMSSLLDEKFDIEWDGILPVHPLKDNMYVQITFFQRRL